MVAQTSGQQVALGDFPVTIVMHPQEKFAAVLHAGYGDHEIVIVDLTDFRIASRASLPETFVGLRFNSSGSELFASGAEKETVHRFDFKNGYLSNHRQLQVVPVKERQVPAGITLSPDDKTLYVACPWGNTLCVMNLAKPEDRKFIKFDDESYPYFPLPSADGKRLFVSLWGKSSIAVVNLSTMAVDATWPTQSHPTESLLTKDQKTLYVACANSNNVSVLDTETGKAIETIRRPCSRRPVTVARPTACRYRLTSKCF